MPIRHLQILPTRYPDDLLHAQGPHELCLNLILGLARVSVVVDGGALSNEQSTLPINLERAPLGSES